MTHQAAFENVAKVLRWRILAKKSHTVREVDLILGLDSLTKVLVLGWESRFKPWTLFFCIVWVSRRSFSICSAKAPYAYIANNAARSTYAQSLKNLNA